MQDYETIATFTYPGELAVVRSFLESHDIACYVRDELTVQVHNFYSNAIGNIRLEVPTAQKDTALSLLREHGFEQHILFEKPEAPETPFSFKEFYKHMPWGVQLFLVVFVIFFLVQLFYLFGGGFF